MFLEIRPGVRTREINCLAAFICEVLAIFRMHAKELHSFSFLGPRDQLRVHGMFKFHRVLHKFRETVLQRVMRPKSQYFGRCGCAGS